MVLLCISDCGYWSYWAVLSIFNVVILLILSNTQYFRGSILNGTGAYKVRGTSSILVFILYWEDPWEYTPTFIEKRNLLIEQGILEVEDGAIF